ncbi:glycosyltransferase [Lewinella sp. IMCC34191]|uniref:glycosyltransferase n=1 Tax=Lewinella sp. IMCC34191 TaxID=2259172 RepID=UPI0018E5740F|nr:glycosyltransferase [Lewinella sp. IMCC34191]
MLNEPVVRSPSRYEQVVIRLLILVGLLSIVNFCYYFFQPEFVGHPVLYALLCIVMVYGLIRDLTIWYYYLRIKVPATPVATRSYSVDVLTTFYPGEPYEMIVRTLRAIQQIRYPHTAYLCDEADDPYLKEVCRELGVIHVTRQEKVNAKAGNINNALKQATGEICLILDPDHIPQPDFLDYVVPHFQDPEIGFVQCVQAYYNKFDSIVAKGSAQQTFHFYGPMMMCMNSYGTVNAIGANCTFRRAALDSIGGHAPGLAEDMHTAMLLYREGWKAVYVPRILAKGLVPSTLTAYFKQQIKWSRGTFDLLVKVYPNIFSRLTWRQRLHYLLIPIHYLAGLAYFVGFLIPILSLALSDVPWTGHFGFFLLIGLPVVFSSFVLRFYIQKWLISDDERGFHIVGGVLEIVGWWVFTLGFLYTLINKKVPYLPTPKDDESTTHFSLLLPNLVVGFVSIFAVIFGLQRDLTPFSIIMAAFALLNTGFMFFSVYLAFGATNRFRTFRKRFPRAVRTIGRHGKQQLLTFLDVMTVTVRALAPLLLVLVCLAAFHGTTFYDRQSLDDLVITQPDSMPSNPILGLFSPSDPNGFSNLDSIAAADYHPRIISSYIAWSGQPVADALEAHLARIDSLQAVPMITWEPWVSHFPQSDSLPEARIERRGLYQIAQGSYDEYIVSMAQTLREVDGPVYLRFAHEFDNPSYPWSPAGNNAPEDYKRAWRHVWEIFRQEKADNVAWVWNPWHADGIEEYYPGDAYVDYFGITSLNYGPGNETIPSLTFAELYRPFHETFSKLSDKDVLLTEFGSLGDQRTKAIWVTQATKYIAKHRPEIHGIVAFESALDANVPQTGGRDTVGVLDWTGNATYLFEPDRPVSAPQSSAMVSADFRELSERVIGVGYKKGSGWVSSDYIPARKNIISDYRAMRAAGINTIRVTDPGIYAHNLLTLAEEHDLQVIYSFWIDGSIDFQQDVERLAELRESILNEVANHIERQGIVHWNLGNDVLHKLSTRYAYPELEKQRAAYFAWVTDLLEAIKRLDPSRPVYHTVDFRPGLDDLLHAYPLLTVGVDAIGVRVGGYYKPDKLEKLMANYGGRIALADIEVGELADLPSQLTANYVVLSNWQNEWRTNSVTYDGLLDFQGRKQLPYVDWMKRQDADYAYPDFPTLRILPPARIPIPGEICPYQAIAWIDNQWVNLSQAPDRATLEWSIARLDPYGNPVQLTILGQGTEIDLVFPNNHLYYQMRLTITDGEFATSVKTPLLPE